MLPTFANSTMLLQCGHFLYEVMNDWQLIYLKQTSGALSCVLTESELPDNVSEIVQKCSANAPY